MNDTRNLDRLLSGWLEGEAPARAPDDLRNDVIHATARIRPRPAWLVALRGSPMDVIVGGARRRDPRLVPVLLLVGLLLAIVAGAAFVGSQRMDNLAVVPFASATPSPAVPSASVASTPSSPAASPLADASISFEYNVLEIVPGEDAVWVSTSGEDTDELARSIYRLDPVTNEATVVVTDIDADPTSHLVFVESAGSLWVADERGDRMLRFDASTGALLGEIPLGAFPLESAVGFGAVWSPSFDDGTVTRIDPATGQVVATIEISPFGGEGVRDIAVGAELLWVITPRQDVLVGIDPATNTIAREVPLATGLHCEIRAIAGRIWIEDCESTDGLHVIDEAAGRELDRFGAEIPGLGLPFHEEGGIAWFPTGDEVAPLSTAIIPVDVATLQNAELPEVQIGVIGGWFVAGFDSVWYSFGQNVHRLSLEAFNQR
jgi:streptogramin lyase